MRRVVLGQRSNYLRSVQDVGSRSCPNARPIRNEAPVSDRGQISRHSVREAATRQGLEAKRMNLSRSDKVFDGRDIPLQPDQPLTSGRGGIAGRWSHLFHQPSGAIFSTSFALAPITSFA